MRNRIDKESSGLNRESIHMNRVISHFHSLDSWEFDHDESSHEWITTKTQFNSLWDLLDSLTHDSLKWLIESIYIIYISYISIKNNFNCILSNRYNQDWIWYHIINIFEWQLIIFVYYSLLWDKFNNSDIWIIF